MNTERFKSQLAEILQVPTEAVTDEYALDGGNWDSVALMATIALIDEEFNVTVPAKDLTNCQSVKQLADLIAARLEEGPANQS